MEGRVFQNFQKKPRFFKVPKKPKIVTQSVQTCFEHVSGQIFQKFFSPVFHGGSRLLNSEKSRKILKITNMPKIVPKTVQMCFEHVLGRFFRKNFAQFSMEGRVFEKFQKI